MRKKILSLLLACVVSMSFSACGDEVKEGENQSTAGETNETTTEKNENGTTSGENEKDTAGDSTGKDNTDDSVKKGSWSIYWYLCGSDLESGGGFATDDLNEMLQVELPDNVNIVIETGGASEWMNDTVDADKLQRWVYNSEGFTLVDEQKKANMGESGTLEEFLRFAKQNYPAEKTAVVFWNHGGGSVTGAAFDELYNFDSLTLDEMYKAFSAVWTPSEKEQPLELVGFDTCLMATVDVADTFNDIAKYLVASEETEPANGWYYSHWIDSLAKNTSMDGKELGKVICDTYYEGCEAVGTEDNTTLSVTDLSKVGSLLTAYEEFGKEALAEACKNPAFFSELGRVAIQSENYGGNTKEQGYSNMVDLGHIARQSVDILDSADGVLNTLKDCIIYKVGGKYRTEATGLSCYYPYSGDADDFNGYTKNGTGKAFKYLYAYGLNGELDDEGMAYIAEMDIDELPEVKDLTTMNWDNAPLDVNDDGTAFLTLGPEANDILSSIAFSLYYVDEENDMMLLLGTDNDMEADWENGVFYDNFRGVWGSIDGHLVYMELSFEGDDYNLYSVPVLLNGEGYNLQVVYDFNLEEWSIIGARQSIDEHGMADKELRLLKVGDEITTIWYAATVSGDDDFMPYAMDKFKVTADTTFCETELVDGNYSMIFEMRDAMGNYAYSDEVMFECIDGEIYTSVWTE